MFITSNFPVSFLIVIAFANCACGQLEQTKIVDQNELSIAFEYVARKGETNKYLLEDESSKVLPIPNSYEVYLKKRYKIETQTVDLGDTVLTFTLPKSGIESFNKLRILHLTSNELNSNGLEWEDCTILPDRLQKLIDNGAPVEKQDELKRLFPDFEQHKIKCSIGRFQKTEYVTVVSQLSPAPLEPFTEIRVSLVGDTANPKDGPFSYQLAFTNKGDLEIKELNFYSVFVTDLKLNSIEPGQGTCRRATLGNSFGSAICYLGSVRSGQTVIVKLEGEKSGIQGLAIPAKNNEGWMVFGIIKQVKDDPLWDANRFSYKPLSPDPIP